MATSYVAAVRPVRTRLWLALALGAAGLVAALVVSRDGACPKRAPEPVQAQAEVQASDCAAELAAYRQARVASEGTCAHRRGGHGHRHDRAHRHHRDRAAQAEAAVSACVGRGR